jgi:hypothetical protein
MTQLKDTDLYVRKIKYIWVAPLLRGDVKDEDMNEVMLDLIFKIICDKDGNDSVKEDLSLDDFMAAQAYLMTKITPQKKS